MAAQEAVGLLVFNERVIGQPLDGTARGASIAERVPRWQQFRVLLMQFVLEPAEGARTMAGAGIPGCPRQVLAAAVTARRNACPASW